MTEPSDMTHERSDFVTVLAWICIGLAGFATLISGLQNIVFRLVFSDELARVQMTPEQLEKIPAVAGFMFEHMGLMFLLFFLLSVIILVASIGLLNRKNWARWIFIGIMALGIVWNIGGLAVQHLLMSDFVQIAQDAPADFQAQFETMRLGITVVSYVIALGFSALFGWILWKLTRPDIAAEFLPTE